MSSARTLPFPLPRRWSTDTSSPSKPAFTPLVLPMVLTTMSTCWPHGGLQQRLVELAGERRRLGYLRLNILLEREGFMVNHKRVNRLYCRYIYRRIRAETGASLHPFTDDKTARHATVCCRTTVSNCALVKFTALKPGRSEMHSRSANSSVTGRSWASVSPLG